MKRKKKVALLPLLVESLVADACDVFILFVDLCDSTAYKQQCLSSGQPDVHWIVRQLIFLERAAKTAREYGGTVIKTIGDEILASFEATTEPERVLKCAIEIIQGFENLKAFTGPSKIEVKAAIDFGLAYNGAIEDTIPFDPIGLPVDRCARLNSLAKRSEIVFSQDFLGLIEKRISKNTFKNRYGYVSNTDNLKGIGNLTYYKITAGSMEPS
jgi:class 3 adenylate cyclase